ncbi:MAG: FimB/Mfa2 family fimbrial subunit [Candidatus Symbiothrix sp.]|jgi:hypothetical protein|nr:FimB/Mfa2 family fimbrial subunit [Candidatus Symbiothrix sp.]
MKRVISIFNIQWGLILLIALGFAACQDSFDGRNNFNGEGKGLTINLNIPGKLQTGLRALSDSAEKVIDEVDVLAFEYINADSIIYKYTVTGDAKIDGEGKQSMVAVVWAKNGVKQQFVIVTNAHADVDALVGAGVSSKIDTKKSELLAQLKTSLGNNATQWNVDATNFRRLPMWGESQPIEITKDNRDETLDIDLLRMVARIDVNLVNKDGQPKVTDQFKIGAIYLYNTNTAGLIVPTPGNLAPDGKSVIKPSIPAGLDSPRGVNAFSTYPALTPADSLGFKGAIYTFESAVPVTKDLDTITCLVIGGIYTDPVSGIPDTKMSYYRVDLVDKDIPNTYLTILRNHQYTLNITGVNARGYDTQEKAFHAKAVNMIVDIIDADQMNDDIVVNDQYYLSLNKNLFKYSRGSVIDSVFISTDYISKTNPQWEIVSVMDTTAGAPGVDASWIRNRTKTSTGWKFTVDAYTAIGPLTIRTAIVTIKAGILVRTITIQQANVDEASVIFYSGETWSTAQEVQNDTVTLSVGDGVSAVVTPTNLYVKWTPTMNNGEPNPISLYRKPCDSGLEYGAFSFSGTFFGIIPYQPSYDTTPHVNHIEWPTPVNTVADPLFAKGVQIIGEVSNGFLTAKKEIVVQVIHQSITINGIPTSSLTRGQPYTVYIKSNVPWECDVTNSVYQSMLSPTFPILSGPANATVAGQGTAFTFTVLSGAATGNGYLIFKGRGSNTNIHLNFTI